MLRKALNIGMNSLRRHNFSVMAGKILVRLREKGNNTEEAQTWCNNHQESWENFLQKLDAPLWQETQNVCTSIKEKGEKKIAALGLDLGGGGHYPLLYFFTRYLKPKIIVETGVAAGWSSQALLRALQENGAGKLYSSDFPYFRYKNPEQYVGYVMDETLKANWHLYIDGDRNNLPKIAQSCGPVDLFHYDSDKSYTGRDFAITTIEPSLGKNALIIFDDIQDNLHFRDYVARKNWFFRVFGFEGKFIGLTGPALKSL